MIIGTCSASFRSIRFSVWEKWRKQVLVLWPSSSSSLKVQIWMWKQWHAAQIRLEDTCTRKSNQILATKPHAIRKTNACSNHRPQQLTAAIQLRGMWLKLILLLHKFNLKTVWINGVVGLSHELSRLSWLSYLALSRQSRSACGQVTHVKKTDSGNSSATD